MSKKKEQKTQEPKTGTWVKFKNGDKTIVMKTSEIYEDGSVKLIDGDKLKSSDIIEYITPN